MAFLENPYIVLLISCCLSALFCLCLGWFFVRQRKQVITITRELKALQSRLDDLEKTGKVTTSDFTAALDDARIRARLQVSGAGGQLPEKYRYVAAMAKQGMGAEELAEILNVSSKEAEQLVSLSKVAQKRG